MSEQERLRRKISAYGFASWELHIFLDTHPDDCDAGRKLKETRQKLKELTDKYEAAYGPIHENSSNTSRWAWITDPWPWEPEANE